MKPITIEDIDTMASDLRDQLCTSSDSTERQQFEITAHNYLKEALDPWREGWDKNIPDKKPADYCDIGMSSCRCGWKGEYPVSGCPQCHHSFVE